MKIFEKYGLDVAPNHIASGSASYSALLAGDVHVVSDTASAAVAADLPRRRLSNLSKRIERHCRRAHQNFARKETAAAVPAALDQALADLRRGRDCPLSDVDCHAVARGAFSFQASLTN